MTVSRRRGSELERALLDATLHEVTEHGYAATTYEAVAARAGTSKTVLYRRWPTKAEMVLAAVSANALERTRSLENLPGRSTLRADVIALLTGIRALMSPTQRRVVLALLTDLPDEDTAVLNELLFSRAEELIGPIVDRARRRGDLGPAPISDEILRLPLDLARHDVLLGGPPSDARIAALADDVVLPLWRHHCGPPSDDAATTSGQAPSPAAK